MAGAVERDKRKPLLHKVSWSVEVYVAWYGG